jgi:hypothetical protein
VLVCEYCKQTSGMLIGYPRGCCRECFHRINAEECVARAALPRPILGMVK